MRCASWLLAAAVMLGVATACGDDGPEATTIVVFAASSLTDTFEEIGAAFEAEHDGVSVQFSFAGSSELVTQIRGGAPADVFASADEANMAKITGEDLTAAVPRVFATNTLTIAVPAHNPAGIERLDDLRGADLQVVVCAPVVPCGAATATVEDVAGVDIEPASEEQNVTDVLTKVATGQADAGLVYATDVARAEDVEGVGFPESSAAVNRYPIAVMADAGEDGLAHAFVDFVLGRPGRDVLAEAGFGRP